MIIRNFTPATLRPFHSSWTRITIKNSTMARWYVSA